MPQILEIDEALTLALADVGNGSNRDRPADDETPQKLKPYLAHSVDLTWARGSTHATARCPFCGKDGKFSVQIDTGQWRCFVCATGTDKGGGNAYTFINALWEASPCPVDAANELAASRGLLSGATVQAWGWRVSITSGEWIIPGWTPAGKMCQLYRWSLDHSSGKRVMMSTTKPDKQTLNLGLMCPQGRPPIRKTSTSVNFCEGPWDGMAMWEVMSQARRDGDLIDATGSLGSSMAATCDVVSVPGANNFRDDWAKACEGKITSFFFDNDHPSQTSNGRTIMPGFDGMMRSCAMVQGKASDVRYLAWGDAGYNTELPNGYDLRDAFMTGTSLNERIGVLAGLLSRSAPYTGESAQVAGRFGHDVECIPCTSWSELMEHWYAAMRMRKSMTDVLTAMIAVSASTMQSGDQLFLQVIGDAGSGKTRFCDAMLTSNNCFPLEHITGFHSGWKGENGEECSLISRVNGKTMITPEGDVQMSSPKFAEIMSQQRRIFDGSSGATYKNSSEDKRWTGLRTPWIMAGTPALMDTDQSRLGDRFLRAFIEQPSEDEKLSILDCVGDSALRSVLQTSDGSAGSCLDERLREAYARTGGYVDHLRDNIAELLAQLEIDRELLKSKCSRLALLTADCRARPNPDTRKQEVHDTKELPSRLMAQYIRLTVCMAAAMEKRSVDTETLEITKKVAFDTSKGKTLDIIRMMYATNKATGKPYQETGINIVTLAMWLRTTEEKLGLYMLFLDKIGVMTLVPTPQTRGVWRATDRVYRLYKSIVED